MVYYKFIGNCHRAEKPLVTERGKRAKIKRFINFPCWTFGLSWWVSRGQRMAIHLYSAPRGYV